MNFKKTLVALATAGFVSGAMASDVELDNGIWSLSAEGVSVKETASMVAADEGIFDFFLSKEIPASGKVAITFGDGFQVADAFDSYADHPIANGSVNFNTVQDAADAPFATIKYGSASFTFVKSAWDEATKTLTLTLGNGQPLLGGASFGLDFDKALSGLEMTNVATVSVKSMTKDGVEIESFSKVVSETKAQFAIKTVDAFSNEVSALNRFNFTDGQTATLSTNGKLRLINDTSLKAPAIATDIDVELMAEFDDVANATTRKYWGGSFGISSVSGGEVSGSLDGIPVTGTDAGKAIIKSATVGTGLGLPADATTGVADDFIINYTANANDLLVTPFTVKADLQISGLTETTEYLVESPFGSWDLQGGVINVPYLPVNYPHLSANVEISNEDDKDAVIYVEAFDQDGNYYPRVQLAQVATGKTVTKVSDADLINAFGLADNRKLSVTFTFDAEGDADLITLAPYYRQNESRINVLSDEYKGK
jgi:hypothetical protein